MPDVAAAGFDGNAYRKRVLVALKADFSRADPNTGDPFFVADLDPELDDTAAINQRFEDVYAFWQKERNHPRYKDLVAELVARRDAYLAVLTDRVARGEARARVTAARNEADSARFGELDRLAGKLVAQHGGIPGDKLAQLRVVARRRGIEEPEFSRWLGTYRVLNDAGGAAQPAWDPGVRRQIRSALDELGRLTGDPVGHATLWAFLGVGSAAPVAELVMRHAALAEAAQLARHDRRKTLAGDLLADVKLRLLMPDGPAGYQASILADAGDVIAPDVEEAMIIDNEVSAAQFESLVQRVVGLGWGIGPVGAREVVRRAAASLGASLVVAPLVETVVCGAAACRRPQPPPPPGAPDVCRYCAEPLHVPCPACARRVGAALAVCPYCGVSLATHRAAVAAARAAAAELAAGRPVAAAAVLTTLDRPPAGSRASAELVTVDAAVKAALVAAQAEWRALEADLAARRVGAAYDRAARLTRIASDVRGPAGQDPAAVRDDLADRRAALQARVRAAGALAPADAEVELAVILLDAPDLVEADIALARIPLAAPTDPRGEPAGDSVTVSWAASPAPGQLAYRIRRLATDSSTGEVAASGIGRTTATRFEDAGAPGGALVSYEIVAVSASGRRSSPPITTAPIQVLRGLATLRADVVVAPPDVRSASGQRVVLSWPPVPGSGEVVIERTTDSDADAGPARRLQLSAPGECIDDDCRPGVNYRYWVYLAYRDDASRPLPTEGRSVTVVLTARPRGVTEIWANTDPAGVTTVSFRNPPDGQVRLYATPADGSDGPDPFGPVDAELALAELDAVALRLAARLVGTGRRRIQDPSGRGAVRYSPVTVVGERAVPGASLVHWAIGRPSELQVRPGVAADELVVSFTLPPGVTEAKVVWRSGAEPTGPEDPAASVGRITNTKLEIHGGYTLRVPRDGRSLFVAVYPIVRRGPSGTPVAVPQGVSTVVREQ